MGRQPEGPKLYRDPRTGLHYVRFTHKKKRYFEPTGETDRGRAQEKKPQIYAEVVAGKRRVTPNAPRDSTPIEEPLAEWLEAIEPELEKSSYIMAKCYAAKFTEHFVTLGNALDEGRIGDYRRSRLREVKRVTLLKELSGFRQFMAWCQEQGKIDKAPSVEAPSKNVAGKPDTKRKHKAKATKITPDEAWAMIDYLSEWSRRARRGKIRHRVQDHFIVAWETGLRPVTVGRLRVPEHYRKGATELFVSKEIDKSRFERHIPITQAAREALDRSAKKSGPIFGPHDYRESLEKAKALAVKAGRLDPERAAIISPYDFRHGRTTDLVSNTKNLAAVAYLVGHRHVATTSKYVEAPKEGAAQVLREIEGSRSKRRGANRIVAVNSGGKPKRRRRK